MAEPIKIQLTLDNLSQDLDSDTQFLSSQPIRPDEQLEEFVIDTTPAIPEELKVETMVSSEIYIAPELTYRLPSLPGISDQNAFLVVLSSVLVLIFILVAAKIYSKSF